MDVPSMMLTTKALIFVVFAYSMYLSMSASTAGSQVR